MSRFLDYQLRVYDLRNVGTAGRASRFVVGYPKSKILSALSPTGRRRQRLRRLRKRVASAELAPASSSFCVSNRCSIIPRGKGGFGHQDSSKMDRAGRNTIQRTLRLETCARLRFKLAPLLHRGPRSRPPRLRN
jgi:hypothetical protein